MSEPDQAPKTRGERKALKYKEQIEAFKVSEKSQIKNGLVMERKTTDCGCCLIFIATVLTMAGLAGYAIWNGNVMNLIGGVDGDFQICGGDGLKDYPHLYITDLQASSLEAMFQTAICVEKCPQGNRHTINCAPTTSIPNCNAALVIDNEYATKAFGAYCFPENVDDLPAPLKDGWNKFLTKIKDSQVGKSINDVKIAKISMSVCLGLSAVYSIIYIYMMSRFADCMAKLCILIIEVCMIAGIGACFFLRQADGSGSHENAAYLWTGIGIAIFWVIFNMLLCCYWKQVKIAIAVVDATADFFAATKRLVFVSGFYFVVALIFCLVWIAAAGCVLSLNTITADPSVLQGKLVQWTSIARWGLIFMIVGLIWVVFWIQDKTGFICMVSASSYYFTSSAEKEGSASVMTGFKFAYFKHAGSLAFGSLIHTLVTIVRIIVEAAADNANRGGENVAAQCALCCIRCCVRCFEDLVEYMNKIAYAYMAVSGDSYCTSAWNGFMLNLKHCSKYTFGIWISSMFIRMGILAITALNMATCYFIMRYGEKSYEAVSSVWSPLALIGVATFIIAYLFLSLFDEATLATLHCLAIDMDMNEGKPAFGPPTFHEKISKVYGDDKQVHYEQLPGQNHHDGLATNTGSAPSNVNQMV